MTEEVIDYGPEFTGEERLQDITLIGISNGWLVELQFDNDKKITHYFETRDAAALLVVEISKLIYGELPQELADYINDFTDGHHE